MKLLLLVLAAVVAQAYAGGYLAAGGVYQFDPDKNLDYMQQARDAGRFAWNQRLENELEQEDVNRNVRKADAYIPTFFTSAENHAALTAAANRPQRELGEEDVDPTIYYHHTKNEL